MKKFTGISFFFLICFKLLAQNINPPKGKVFNDTILPSVFIIINPDSLDLLYKPGLECSDHEYPADFIFHDGISPNDTIKNIGFRFRGYSSRTGKKKSFKVSFNTFVKGRKYNGLEKLDLNGARNDPSVIREKLYWDAAAKLNIPATRANHVKLFINGSFFGLYINVEAIDENYCRQRFGNDEGNLYKCFYTADLNYKGYSGNAYKYTFTLPTCGLTSRVYELQNNTSEDNYQNLADFINILNNVGNADFEERIQKYFNVDNYLRALALEVASGHWDNNAFNKNNFYLYYNIQTRKMEYITFDADNTYGIDWLNITWATRNIYNWSMTATTPTEKRPLYTRILSVPAFRDRFSFYMNTIVNDVYNTTLLFPEIDRIKNMIQAAAAADVFRTLDYGFTMNDFNNSYTQITPQLHVKSGLKPYFTDRNASTTSQLQLNNISPFFKWESHTPFFPKTTDSLFFQVYVDDDVSVNEVKLQYSSDSISFYPVIMFDDGMHHDRLAGDKFYGGKLPPQGKKDTLYFYFSAKDNTGLSAAEPFKNVYKMYVGTATPKLFINELMAKNNSTIKDEGGNYEDWFELYNGDTVPVYLGDKFMSTDFANPTKLKLPGFTMKPGEFMVFWADDETTQGPLHTNFKLSTNGEFLGIFDNQQNFYSPIDTVSFGPQNADVSFGRTVDGAGVFSILAKRTPGRSNTWFDIGINEKEHARKFFTIFPNPAGNYIKINSETSAEKADIIIYSMTGSIVLVENNFRLADPLPLKLSAGLYYVMIYDSKDKGNFCYQKLVIK